MFTITRNLFYSVLIVFVVITLVAQSMAFTEENVTVMQQIRRQSNVVMKQLRKVVYENYLEKLVDQVSKSVTQLAQTLKSDVIVNETEHEEL